MAIPNKKEKKKDEKFLFSPQARQHFAKEISKFGFDFDKFLESKRAIAFRYDRPVVLEYESLTDQTSYVSKFIRNTSYFSFEAGTLDWAWKQPHAFWTELRNQSRSEESKEKFDVDRLEEVRTGKSHEALAQEKIKQLSDGMPIFSMYKNADTARKPYNDPQQ